MATKQDRVAPGVIDTIAAGLTVALAQPLLMTVPLLLDAYYWVGWRITPVALSDPIRRWVLRQDTSEARSVADSLERAGRVDLTGIVAAIVPSLLSGADRARVYNLTDRPDASPAGWWVVATLAVAFAVVAVGLYSTYVVVLADAALGRPRSLGATASAVYRAWYRLLASFVLLVAFFALVLGPPIVLFAVLEAIGFGIGGVLLPLVATAGLAMALFFLFVPEAIVVADAGPLRAMQLSVNVVRRNLWPTLGLTAAGFIITVGLGEIWDRLARTAPGLLAAVIANAFFAGGLTIAGILFFNDRLQLLPSGASGRPTEPTIASPSERR